jgi:phosphate transport system substrate-binding protein
LNVRLDSNLAGEDPNPQGADSYPISTLTWILAYQKGNGEKAGTIRRSLLFLLSPAAQNKADDLGYVPLPSELVKKSREAVARIGS